MKEIFNRDNNYYAIDASLLIDGKGNQKIDKLINCWNTFMAFFWHDSGGFWTRANFLQDDIEETVRLLIEQANKPEDEISLEMFCYIENIKDAPLYKEIYHNAMGHWGSDEEYPRHPMATFQDIMKLLKHESYQKTFREERRKAGLPPINIISGSGSV